MATVELIYEYLHQHGLVSRTEFAARFEAPVLLFRRVRTPEELGMMTRTDPDLGAARRLHDVLLARNLKLRREAYDYRVVRLPAGGEIGVGRTVENEVPLPHRLVSKRHARIACKEDEVRVRDLGSKNGTFIAEERLPANTDIPLQVGQELRVGGVVMRLLSGYDLYDALNDLTEQNATA